MLKFVKVTLTNAEMYPGYTVIDADKIAFMRVNPDAIPAETNIYFDGRETALTVIDTPQEIIRKASELGKSIGPA